MSDSLRDKELVLKGRWGVDIAWEFFLSRTMPPEDLCTAIACVAIADDDDNVILARNNRGWEILGGHIEEGEDVVQALQREALEEGGFVVNGYQLFGHRKVTALRKVPHDQREGHYPFPVSYIPHFVAVTDHKLLEPTGTDAFESGTFSHQEIKDLGVSTLEIIQFGIEAQRHEV